VFDTTVANGQTIKEECSTKKGQEKGGHKIIRKKMHLKAGSPSSEVEQTGSAMGAVVSRPQDIRVKQIKETMTKEEPRAQSEKKVSRLRLERKRKRVGKRPRKYPYSQITIAMGFI